MARKTTALNEPVHIQHQLKSAGRKKDKDPFLSCIINTFFGGYALIMSDAVNATQENLEICMSHFCTFVQFALMLNSLGFSGFRGYPYLTRDSHLLGFKVCTYPACYVLFLAPPEST